MARSTTLEGFPAQGTWLVACGHSASPVFLDPKIEVRERHGPREKL